MPRLLNNQIDQIKTKTSLVILAEQQDHILKRQGDELALCCPFHDDASPLPASVAQLKKVCQETHPAQQVESASSAEAILC